MLRNKLSVVLENMLTEEMFYLFYTLYIWSNHFLINESLSEYMLKIKGVAQS